MRTWDAAARAWTALAALIGGFVLARSLPDTPPWLWFTLAAAFALTARFFTRRACAAALLVSVVALGAGWWSSRTGALTTDQAEMPALIATRGVVVDPPRTLESSSPIPFGPAVLQSFTLRTERGTLRVRASGRLPELRPGDRISIQGAFSPIRPPRNPGERDPRPRASQQRLLGSIDTAATLIAQEAGPLAFRDRIARAAHTLRARALTALEPIDVGAAGPSSRGTALARSLLLGEDEAALDPAREAFTRVGLSHVLAISGFHLVVLVWSVTIGLRLLGDRGWLEPLIVAALVVIYLLIVPAEAPIVRAGAMAICFLSADALGRRHDRLALLAWIACALLLWRPADAFALGFQLSVGLTGVLLHLGTRVNDRVWGVRLKGAITTPDPTIRTWLAGGFRSLVSASLLCWLVSVPLIAWHTGSISVLAIPATLIVVPLCVLLMWLGFLAILGGVVWPGFARLLAQPIEFLGAWTTDIVLWFDESRFSLVRIAPFSTLLAACCVGLALWWCASGRCRSIPHWLATLLVLGWAGLELRTTSALAPDVLVRIDTLAVGDGTCHIVRSGPDTMLWDCGSLTRVDIGSRTLPRAARALGITRIPVAVLTHPNLDHDNGLLDAARTMGLRTLFVGDATLDAVRAMPHARLAHALAEMEHRGVAIRRIAAGDTLALGDVEARFLWPVAGFDSDAPNERSLVAAFVARGAPLASTSLLLTGDIQEAAIDGLLRSHPDLRTRVLEIPHHGSAIRASVDLLHHVDARVVHQSTGPRRAADPRMAQWHEGRQWGITARDGWVWTEIDARANTRTGSMRTLDHAP